MKKTRLFGAFLTAVLLTAALSACSLPAQQPPEEETAIEEPKAPELPTLGMEPEQVAEAFVQAWLKSVYLYEDDGFTPYTAAAMAAFDPAGSVTMNGVSAPYETLKRNAQYLREKCRYWQYVRQAQGIVRNDFASPCIVQITEGGDDWANAVVSGMMSWTHAEAEGDTGMEFTFTVNLFRTDHRTAYSWLVGDVTEEYDWFDAAYKGDPEFNADTLIAEYDGAGVSFASDASSPKEWKLTEVLREDITDRKHNRDVRILELSLDSAHTAEINAVLSEGFRTILEKYMKTPEAPYDDWKLVIDATAWEDGGILCIAAIAAVPSTSPAPLTVKNVFLDLVSDETLTLAQYAQRAGIDPEGAAASVSAVSEEEGIAAECVCDGVFREDGKTVYAVRRTYASGGTTVSETLLAAAGEVRTQEKFTGFKR